MKESTESGSENYKTNSCQKNKKKRQRTRFRFCEITCPRQISWFSVLIYKNRKRHAYDRKTVCLAKLKPLLQSQKVLEFSTGMV